MLYAFALLLLLLAAITAIPIDLLFSFEGEEKWEGELRVGWLFGLITFPVPIGEEKDEKEEQKRRAKPRKKKKRKKDKKCGRRLLGDAPFRRRSFAFIRDFLGSARIRTFSLYARVGLDDPAETGMLWAVAGPLSAWLMTIENTDIRLEPDFTQEKILLRGKGEMRVVPIVTFYQAVRFALSPVTIKALWSCR